MSLGYVRTRRDDALLIKRCGQESLGKTIKTLRLRVLGHAAYTLANCACQDYSSRNVFHLLKKLLIALIICHPITNHRETTAINLDDWAFDAVN